MADFCDLIRRTSLQPEYHHRKTAPLPRSVTTLPFSCSLLSVSVLSLPGYFYTGPFANLSSIKKRTPDNGLWPTWVSARHSRWHGTYNTVTGAASRLVCPSQFSCGTPVSWTPARVTHGLRRAPGSLYCVSTMKSLSSFLR